MRYGYFDDARREYVITKPDTPLPWINYLGSEAYFGIISNTAGGYSFYRDTRLRRLTRYRYNNTPFDNGGRYIYIRDEADGDFWSPSWMPVRRPVEAYTCRHGQGYTIIGSERGGIASETTYFVPPSANLEVWSLVVSNRRATPAEISVVASVEFCLWDAADDASNFQRNFSTGQIEVEDGVIYHKTEYRERRDHFAYFVCSEPITGYETQRDAFLGAIAVGIVPRLLRPARWRTAWRTAGRRWGRSRFELGLQPGESRRILYVLGYHENPRDQKFNPPESQTINKRTVKPVIARYLNPVEADAAFDALRRYWDGLLGVYQTATPDLATDRMVNAWNAYQCMVTFNMSRSASFYESGIGRGMGFRDSNQDLLGFVHMAPARARERILDTASTQLPTGGAYHQYQPLTKRGNDLVGSNFNDDPLWLVLGVIAYVKETGDFSILDEPVTYDNQAGTETPLFEHLQRSIRYTLDRLGPHGLPLIGRADWNDCLNLNCFSEEPGESFQTTTNKEGKVAESVFIAGLFVLAAHEMADLIDARPAGATPADDPASYRADAARMAATVDTHGWDGAWFRRAYDAFGRVIGSAQNDEGQIFIEPQGICVMAGLGVADGRAAQALESVSERLATPHGIILQQPAFSQYHLHLGEISSYPPGYKENAGIFCHTNPWIMIAEALLGDGTRPTSITGVSIRRCERRSARSTGASRMCTRR